MKRRTSAWVAIYKPMPFVNYQGWWTWKLVQTGEYMAHVGFCMASHIDGMNKSFSKPEQIRERGGRYMAMMVTSSSPPEKFYRQEIPIWPAQKS